jgi:hypothetical protein
VKLSSAGSADAVKPAVASGPATEPASTDAAGGHADDPNDPNADHQFNGEE